MSKVGAVLAVDCDAVIAKSHSAEDWLAREGGAAASEAVFEPFNAKDRAAAGVALTTAGLFAEVARQLFIAELRCLGFFLKSQLLPEPIGDLMQGHTSKAQGCQ